MIWNIYRLCIFEYIITDHLSNHLSGKFNQIQFINIRIFEISAIDSTDKLTKQNMQHVGIQMEVVREFTENNHEHVIFFWNLSKLEWIRFEGLPDFIVSDFQHFMLFGISCWYQRIESKWHLRPMDIRNSERVLHVGGKCCWFTLLYLWGQIHLELSHLRLLMQKVCPVWLTHS